VQSTIIQFHQFSLTRFRRIHRLFAAPVSICIFYFTLCFPFSLSVTFCFQPFSFRLSSFFLMSVHYTQLLLSRSSFQLQSHFQHAFSQPIALHGTTDQPFLWHFGSYFFFGQWILLGVAVGIFPYYLSLNLSVTAHSPHFTSGCHLPTRILTNLACIESTSTHWRSLQTGFSFGPFFTYQDETVGRVAVRLYSRNIVLFGRPLEEFHRVQRFNIQVEVSCQQSFRCNSLSLRDTWPHSMLLQMTNPFWLRR